MNKDELERYSSYMVLMYEHHGMAWLSSQLVNKDAERRFMARRTLQNMAREQLLKKIIAILRCGNAGIRMKAAKALVKFGREAVVPLSEAMKNKDEVFRYRAAEVLWRILGERPYIWEEDEFLKRISLEPQRIDRERIVKAFSKALTTYFSERVYHNMGVSHGIDYERRYDREYFMVLKGIAELGYAESVKPLIEFSMDSPKRLLELLSKTGRLAVKPLIEELKKVRQQRHLYFILAMIDALGEIGGEDAVNGLRFFLSHTESWFRRQAALALEKTGCIRESDLLELLKDKDRWICFWALGALAKIGGPRVNEILAGLLEGDDFLMRDRAAELIWESGNEDMIELMSELFEGKAYRFSCDDDAG